MSKNKTSARHSLSTQEKALFEQLITLLADIRQPKEMCDFLSDFLSQSEQSTLAKRLAIIWELSQEKSYEEIKSDLGVSSATISSASEIKNQPIISTILEKIHLDKKVKIFLTKIGISK